MQADIHPNYHEIKVACRCGNSFSTRSTFAEAALHIEVCAKCHPLFTGKARSLKRAGAVEKFFDRYKGVLNNKEDAGKG